MSKFSLKSEIVSSLVRPLEKEVVLKTLVAVIHDERKQNLERLEELRLHLAADDLAMEILGEGYFSADRRNAQIDEARQIESWLTKWHKHLETLTNTLQQVSPGTSTPTSLKELEYEIFLRQRAREAGQERDTPSTPTTAA